MPAVADRFLYWCCIMLGGLTGTLIALPVALTMTGLSSFLIILSGTIAGVVSGIRRSESRPFMYFCLIAIPVLLVLISLQSAGKL